MAMRHLWCACTKFQPNPASRRVLSRSQSGNGSRKTTRIIPSVSNNQILKAMRKSFVYAAGLMCLALSITDCQKELVDQTTPASEPNFELFAQPVTTKTANNGLDTKWVAKDAINVFHAEAGSTAYDSDGKFTVKDIETGRFDGTVSKSLSADKSYDWYAFYPYTSQITTPDNTASGYCYIGSRSDASQTQTGDNNMFHICGSNYPLYGIAKNVNASDVPSIQMQHLTSVIKIVVTNSTEEELSLNSVSFTAEENISGQFYIAFNSETPKYTSAGHPSKTANLTVSDVKVAPKAKATVYMAIKPFTAKPGSTLKLAVNGYEKTLTLKNDITFTAGHIKKLKFDYDKVVVDYVTLPWTEDFSGDLSLYTLVKGSSDTKIYNEKLAGGTAPELLISKSNGSFSAKVKAEEGNYLLTFKHNGNGTLSVLSSDDNVSISKESDTEYFIGVPSGGRTFTLTIKNTHAKDNARVDDISIVRDERGPVVSVAEPSVSVKAEGDNCSISYSIKHPVAGGILTAKSSETWVNTFDFSTSGKLAFVVDANEGASRTATLTLSYPGAEDVAVTVQQREKGAIVASKTVTYKVTSKTAVSTSGTAPDGSSVTFNSTSAHDVAQMTSGKSQTYTLTGYDGMTIKKVILSMKSNNKDGAGKFSLIAGTTSLASISEGTTFNKWYDNTSYSSEYKDINVAMTNTNYVIGKDEKVVLKIEATKNSLYCQSIKIVYE